MAFIFPNYMNFLKENVQNHEYSEIFFVFQ